MYVCMYEYSGRVHNPIIFLIINYRFVLSHNQIYVRTIHSPLFLINAIMGVVDFCYVQYVSFM